MRYVAGGGTMVDGNYHLADSASPAVGVGTPGAVTEDFDGEPRNDGSPDVGADEFVP
jgi:hypothetical protein